MKQWEQIVRDRNILRHVGDQDGRPMYTEERLFTYLQHFERDFAESKARIIDATEGGCLKRGTAPMKLADAIAQYCTETIGSAPPAHSGLSWSRLEECIECLQRRRTEARQIEQISQDTLPLLREVRDHVNNQPRVNRAIAKIDELRARMHELGPCYNLIMQLTQKSEMHRFKADRHIAAAKVEGLERQRRQVNRDIENVESVVTAAVEFQNLMDHAMENVRRFMHPMRREAA
jgi:hypothetical protein